MTPNSPGTADQTRSVRWIPEQWGGLPTPPLLAWVPIAYLAVVDQDVPDVLVRGLAALHQVHIAIVARPGVRISACGRLISPRVAAGGELRKRPYQQFVRLRRALRLEP